MLWGPLFVFGAASIELQQVVHRLPEILAAELLQKRDGVPARAVGVALPGPAFSFSPKEVTTTRRTPNPEDFWKFTDEEMETAKGTDLP